MRIDISKVPLKKGLKLLELDKKQWFVEAIAPLNKVIVESL